MLDGEQLAIVFDREDIADRGVRFGSAVDVVEAFRLLAEHALKFRAMQNPNSASIGTMTRPFDLILHVSPVYGSIKLPLWAVVGLGVIELFANGSQVSGITIRDAMSAISSSRKEEIAGDEITEAFVKDRETNVRLNELFKAAARTECTYVAIERGNEVVMLHGGPSAQFSLIGSQRDPSLPPSQVPSILLPGTPKLTEVNYRGRLYPAFVVDQAGHSPDPSGRGFSSRLVAALIWGSQAPLVSTLPYTLSLTEIDPVEVTHGSDIPAEFLGVDKVYFVNGATELDYR